MNRRGFLAALGVAPVLAKLGLAKGEPSAPAPCSTEYFEPPIGQPAFRSLPPISPPRVEVTLENATGRDIVMGEPCGILTDLVDESETFYRAGKFDPEGWMNVFALERVAPGARGRFLVYGEATL